MQPLTRLLTTSGNRRSHERLGSAILGKAKMIIAAVWQARIVCA